MKKLLLCLATALFLVGCAQDFDLAERPAPEPQQAVPVSETLTRSLTGAVYNEVIDGWMIPQADPFALENVQAAYDKLAEGRSAQTLSKSEAAEFQAGKKLAPTHYALKIYPKSEEEQWRVEMMKDVGVDYIPFCFSRLTRAEAARVEQSGKTRSAANTFTEKSPYTVTYNRTEVTDGGPTGPVTYQLPILYAVWPADKPLPIDLEYVVDYPVLLPRVAEATMSSELLEILENEAMSIALKTVPIRMSLETPKKTKTRASYDHYAAGRFTVYDNILQANVPLANLRVRCQLGTDIQDVTTDDNGVISFFAWSSSYLSPTTLVDAKVTFTYQDIVGRWKIVATTSTVPVTRSTNVWLTVSTIAGSPEEIVLLPDNYKVNEIHRAVNYFYNVQNTFPDHYISGGTVIRAYRVNGRPFFADKDRSIYIYNREPEGLFTGDIFHELGHLIHYKNNISSYSYKNNEFLYESFASYVGWYLGETYYQSIGWTKPSASSDITLYGRQGWDFSYGEDEGRYSPLFVDLTDDYNQSSAYYARPNDDITNIPPSVIWNIITTCQTWTQCRAKLQSYVGTYYTSADFGKWIQHFDLWESHNPQN